MATADEKFCDIFSSFGNIRIEISREELSADDSHVVKIEDLT